MSLEDKKILIIDNSTKAFDKVSTLPSLPSEHYKKDDKVYLTTDECVYQVEYEYPENPTHGGLVWRKLKVPVLESRSITPSTQKQTIIPSEGYDGISEIEVEAINLQSKIVPLSTEDQDITPDEGYNGFSEVSVQGVSKDYLQVKIGGVEKIIESVQQSGSVIVINCRE